MIPARNLLGPAARRETVVRLRLDQLNKKWTEIVGSNGCPAVLGLLGLPEAESDDASGLIRSTTKDHSPSYQFEDLRQT